MIETERILLINTCGEKGFVALADRAGVIRNEELPSRGTSEAIVPAVHRLFPEGFAGLAAVGVVAGPGSFTGMRVGLSTAKGLCEATGARLVVLSRLALVAEAVPAGQVIALLDAGRGEFYAGAYEGGQCVSERLLLRSEVEMLLVRATAVTCELRVAESLNSGIALVPEPDEAMTHALTRRRVMACEWSDVAAADANYIRRTDAERLLELKAGPL